MFCRFIRFSVYFLLALLPLIFWSGCSKSTSTNYGPKNTRLIGRETPESAKPHFDLTEGIESDSSDVRFWYPIVQSQLDGLERRILTTLTGVSASAQPFLAPNLKYSGIDRASAKSTYSQEQIEISRWRYHKGAPKFLNDGLIELIRNHYEPWSKCENLRTELSPFRLNRIVGPKSNPSDPDVNILEATVVARTYGEIREDVGLEATSMWKTHWQFVSDQTIELVMVQILAHEETVTSSKGGKIFQDITRNVISSDDGLNQQLNHGLDDWAARLPGLDIIGNQGIAVGDPNRDGFEDIYICQPHGLPNIFLRQDPDGTAEDFAKSSNINVLDESRAALFVDLDNDGDEDLAITTDEYLLLFSNSGKGVFQLEHRLLSGFDGGSLSSADFDNDGDLDLFVCKYHQIQRHDGIFPRPDSFVDAQNGGRNVLLRNEEGWSFSDVTDQVGLNENNQRFSRCAVWCDFDFDDDQDLFVVNEFGGDILYENQSGWFADVTEKFKGLQDPSSSRSVSVGEFNGDGRFDFFVAANSLPQSKQFRAVEVEGPSPFCNQVLTSTGNESRLVFSKNTKDVFAPYRLPAPIFETKNTYASSTIDINNDGFEDIALTNGLVSRGKSNGDLESQYLWQAFLSKPISGNESQTEQKQFETITRTVDERIRAGASFGGYQRNVCLLSIGPLGFANFSAVSGLDFLDDARAIVTTDWDQNGTLDLVMTSRTAPQVRFLGNKLETQNQFVGFRLTGSRSNRDAIGARVEVFASHQRAPLIRSVSAGTGTLSQSSKRLHFGIPKGATVEKVHVHWPSGIKQKFERIKANARYHIVEGNAEPAELTDSRFDIDLFKPVESKSPAAIENVRTMFYPPVGIPFMEFQGDRDFWAPVKNIDEMPLAVIFVDDSQASADCLREFAKNAENVASAKLDVLAIHIAPDERDEITHFETMRDIVAEAQFPFRFGSASPSMVEKTRIVYGDWFSHKKIPSAPFCWLMDKNGNVRVAYTSGQVRGDRVLSDLALLSGGIKMTLDNFSPREGIWTATRRAKNYGRIKTRLTELGYANDAEVLEPLSNSLLAKHLCRRAHELSSIGERVDAREAYATALDFDPKCQLACVELGQLLIKEAAIEQDGVLKTTKLNEAESLFERAIRIDPTDTDAILGRADVSRLRNNLDEAIKQLNTYLEVNPNRFEVHAIIGRLHFHKQQYVKATEHLLRAWERRPTLPHVAGDLGFLYLNGQAYEDARSFLKFATRLQPSETTHKKHLAHAEFLTGNYESANRMLNEVTKLLPSDLLPKSLHAWLLATCPYETQRDGQKSLEICLPLTEIHSDRASMQEIAAAAFAEVEDYDNAMKYQQKAVDMVQNGLTTENYTNDQKEGMLARLKVFKRKRPYRMSDINQIPIRPPGVR